VGADRRGGRAPRGPDHRDWLTRPQRRRLSGDGQCRDRRRATRQSAGPDLPAPVLGARLLVQSRNQARTSNTRWSSSAVSHIWSRHLVWLVNDHGRRRHGQLENRGSRPDIDVDGRPGNPHPGAGPAGIPFLVLTAVAMIPLVLPVVAIALVAAVVAVPVLVLRCLGRRLSARVSSARAASPWRGPQEGSRQARARPS
jgi:hypothetical protein